MDAESKAKLIEMLQGCDIHYGSMTLTPAKQNFLVSLLWGEISSLHFTAVGSHGDLGLFPLIGGIIQRASLSIGRMYQIKGFSIYDSDTKLTEILKTTDDCVVISGLTMENPKATLKVVKKALGECRILKFISILDCELGFAEEMANQNIPFESLVTLKEMTNWTSHVSDVLRKAGNRPRE